MKSFYIATIIVVVAVVLIGGYIYYFEQKIPLDKTPIETADKNIPAKLYYYNAKQDLDASGNIQCSRAGLVAVDREISDSRTPIEDTIKLLLQGQLTAEEKASGISTEFPLANFSLASSTLVNGKLILTFKDPQYKSTGGSCRVGILWFQIEATAKQFPEVREVDFLPKDLFQP